MQDQCAPPRFRGVYPHALTIPTSYLPTDKFVQEELKQHQLREENGKLTGHFPKLIMKIKDKEIQQLASEDMSTFDSIDCKDISCTCEDKFKYLQIFDANVADRDSILYNNCKRTIFAAAKRQIKSAPCPDLNVAREFVDFSKRKIDELMGEQLNSFGYSYNQWYNHLNRAKQLRMDAIHEYFHGTDPEKKHYGGKIPPEMLHYQAICKMEIQGIDGKPRMVCAIPDLIKYVMGPVCWKLEEIFTKYLPSYCGGMNLTEMQDKINGYIDEGFVIVAEGDGSAFDNTQDVLLKEVDRYVYNRIKHQVYHVPTEVFEIVSNAYYKVMEVLLNVNGKKKNLLTYAVLGTVFSGDCDTTLMNTCRMGLYNWFTNEKAGLQFHEEFLCFSKGDDFTNMYKATTNLDKVKDTYDKYWLKKPSPTSAAYDGLDERIMGLGQILKFIEFGPPNAIKFCSLRAWYTDYNTQHIYLTRDPGKFTTLSKYSRKALHMTSTQISEYCIEQAVAILAQYKHIKYFEEFARQYLIAAKRFSPKYYKRILYKGRTDKRKTLPLEITSYDGYNRQPRENAVRIVGTYWETMQKIERGQYATLSETEARIVNEQLEAEFPTYEIRLLTGLTG